MVRIKDEAIKWACIVLNAAALLVLSLYAGGMASDDIQDGAYKVKKGDTLWDISSDKMKSPFMWPKLWKNNPGIRNPHLIYPGQTLNIPGEFSELQEGKGKKASRKELLENGRVITPDKLDARKISIGSGSYLVSRSALFNSGFIAVDIPVEGSILGDTLSKRALISIGDSVYLSMKRPPVTNAKYYVVSAPEPLIHPLDGKVIGYHSRIKGALVIAGMDNGYIKASIKDSFEEISIGDLLASYYDIELPEAPAVIRRPAISGIVVKIRDANAVGKRGIVYINRGVNDGIRVGDMFNVLNDEVPKVSIGTIQVVNAGDKFSVAMVESAVKEVTAGDTFKN
jgi:LysM repeat protein